MQERIERLDDVIANSWFDAGIRIHAIRLARIYLTPTPNTFSQHTIKFLLSHFQYLRRKIMEYANDQTDIDIYNLQAIEILERAGITEPSEQQIITIERLLKAA